MKGYSFLDGSLLGKRTYLVQKKKKKKLSLPREEPKVVFAIPAKEHFAGACAFWLFASSVNCDLGGQWAMDRFEE